MARITTVTHGTEVTAGRGHRSFRYAVVAMARTRSEEAHQRVLAAAASLLGERGIDSLSVDEVASRSGVAKTTIYRHWSSRQALVVDAIAACAQPVPTPNTGELRTDLVLCFDDIVRASAEPGRRPLFLALLEAAARDPELERLRLAFLDERQRPVRTVLELAVGRGELPAELDLDLAVDLLVGPLLHRLVLRGVEVDADDLEAVVDCVVAGLRTAPVTSGR